MCVIKCVIVMAIFNYILAYLCYEQDAKFRIAHIIKPYDIAAMRHLLEPRLILNC